MALRSSRRIAVEARPPLPPSPAVRKSFVSFGNFSLPRRNSQSAPNLERDHRFSWPRCFISLVSYALLLSDVLRTGLGLHGVSSSHGLRALEPDMLLFLGPTYYSVQHLTRLNATTSSSTAYWPYKYDTTSIPLRAFAEHLNLTAWSPCVLYKATFDESNGLPTRAVFTMIDSLVAAISKHKSAERVRSHLTLRTENLHKDRLHHYAFSYFFTRTVKRTNQAIHFDYHGSAPAPDDSAARLASLCRTSSPSEPRPNSCGESWAKWTDDSADTSSSVWKHIPKRLAKLAALYPNHTIDAVVFDGIDDFTRGSITNQGHKAMEVVVLTRIRICGDSTSSVCETVAVDDYRYEAAALVVNVDSWYGVVATLRVVGQAYTWLRVLLLVAVCTHARRQQRETRDFLHEAKATLRTLFLIPSQVVIYGSRFPITLYMLAHLIDSPAIYELVSSRFITLFGKFRWNSADFIRHCAVSMRTVWILGMMCHLLLAASTRCVWSPTHGIPGVPEILISLVASLTIFAQYRSLSLRDTRLLQIHEVIPGRRMQQLRSLSHDGTRTLLNNLFFGSTIDLQCLMGAVLSLCGLVWLVWMVKRLTRDRFPYQLAVFSRTLVPYSASSLWPKSRLVVSWYGSIVVKDTPKPQTRSRTIAPLRGSPGVGNVSARTLTGLLRAPEKNLTIQNTEASRQFAHALYSLDKRSREIESAIYLMNLAVMTDPMSFVRLRFFSGRFVAVYECKLTRRRFMLPHGLDKSATDVPLDWDEFTLLTVVNTKDLDWCDLLRCG